MDGAATGGIDDLGVRDRTFSLDDLDVGIAGVVGEPRTVDNAVLYEGAEGVDHVVRKMDDGAQFLSVINQRDSSTEVRYDFPEHYLEIADTGHVVVREESSTGEPVVIIDPAWGRDSSGVSERTSFTVDGRRVSGYCSGRGGFRPISVAWAGVALLLTGYTVWLAFGRSDVSRQDVITWVIGVSIIYARDQLVEVAPSRASEAKEGTGVIGPTTRPTSAEHAAAQR